ncbi:uncharacterized protein LOC123519407 [Portunus trituberculatus]|uniref:uncharacterized protein LOC123519407 n=1 Tax=Portunus trituberculatus TaxID=210409 RepID=UPI001E1D1D07|nr:uncharacterized protein LOC123519407 [Portunus trituberculatus]
MSDRLKSQVKAGCSARVWVSAAAVCWGELHGSGGHSGGHPGPGTVPPPTPVPCTPRTRLLLGQAVDFVEVVASELGSLVPALSLWSATFTSPLFRLQQVSEGLVERHPCLVKLLGRRVEGLVERAAWEGNLCLLQRILHLSLCHNLSVHYQSATSALLQLQCDEGDLRGAEETIKFAQKMEVRLTPPAVRRFLALLSRHRRPAPLTLLALKYHPPPARQPLPPPPTPKYRF